MSNTRITRTQFACATFNNKVENHLIVEVVRHQKVVVELDRWRDGGNMSNITKTHPTLTPIWSSNAMK